MILSQHTNHLHKWLVQLNFAMFTAAMFFFYKIPKYVLDRNNILSSSMCWPTWLVIIWMMNAGRLGSMWPEIVSQKFINFLACPINPLSASAALI